MSRNFAVARSLGFQLQQSFARVYVHSGHTTTLCHLFPLSNRKWSTYVPPNLDFFSVPIGQKKRNKITLKLKENKINVFFKNEKKLTKKWSFKGLFVSNLEGIIRLSSKLRACNRKQPTRLEGRPRGRRLLAWLRRAWRCVSGTLAAALDFTPPTQRFSFFISPYIVRLTFLSYRVELARYPSKLSSNRALPTSFSMLIIFFFFFFLYL